MSIRTPIQSLDRHYQRRSQVGLILRELCRQRGVEMLEGHAMSDHIHMVLSVPPKFSIAHTIGFPLLLNRFRAKRVFCCVKFLSENGLRCRFPLT